MSMLFMVNRLLGFLVSRQGYLKPRKPPVYGQLVAALNYISSPIGLHNMAQLRVAFLKDERWRQ